MLDEDPIIVSEKDFTPTPSSSPTPAADDAARAALDNSAVVSDDGDGDGAPTAEDVSAVEELALSISGPPAGPAAVPSPLQIVSIGSERDAYAFTFHEEELNGILAKIPAGWKVAVVSVVGAFRTGKSFLLSWFLRYLEARCVQGGGAAPDRDDGKEWFERVKTLNQHEGSFDWRGGTARNTTGMWMWSDPYFLPRASGEEVAVLLVDTQGMFDHETTVGLTAAIFGLSTLLSSYQIYNVDKRIQEDNLQQLALFSEYGRIAFEAEEKAIAARADEEGKEKEKEGGDEEGDAQQPAGAPAEKKVCPFQKIEFLIRDWQNFDTEDETDVGSMEGEMAGYLEHVIREREASDLKDTRDQINACFEEVSCFMLTHPGFAVIKNKYEGDVSKIEDLFMRLLDRYCQRVFDTAGTDGSTPRLGPKTVRGRELTAVELGNYIKSYATMFEEIGARFPKAETMLEATSKANNINAFNASHDKYTEIMNAFAGPQAVDYHQKEVLISKHKEASKMSLAEFNEMANFGSRSAIVEARDKLLGKIAQDFEVFESLNDGRNPLLGFETYLLPMIVAFFSYILRWIADFSCSGWSQTCRASSEVLSHIYMVVFFFLAIVATTKAKQISGLIDRGKAAYGMLVADAPSKRKRD